MREMFAAVNFFDKMLTHANNGGGAGKIPW